MINQNRYYALMRERNTIPFEEIPINTEEIAQSLLDIDNKTRVSPFSWTGQFSPQFIEVLLTQYATEEDVVYDPFSGSGTVLSECVLKNISAYGTELNPSAYYMSKFYELSNVPLDRRKRICDSIESILLKLHLSSDKLETLKEEYNKLADGPTKNTFALLTIVSDLYKNGMNLDIFGKKWTKIQKYMLKLPYIDKEIKVFNGDSRRTPFPDDHFSLIITSPPYINVFNYHQNYRRSVEALGYDVLKTAKAEFGSNRKNRGNRYLTVIEYCIDIALALKECIRVSKVGSRIIFVVGRESNVLSVKFCNSELVYNIGCEIFGFDFILRQERQFKNKFGQIIFEDLLHFIITDNSKSIKNNDNIIAMSRCIAKRALERGLVNNTNEDHINLLNEAISKIDLIKPSLGE